MRGLAEANTRRVAIDVTPLAGSPSGIGQFVGELMSALSRLNDSARPVDTTDASGVELLPYVLSARLARKGRGGQLASVPWCFDLPVRSPMLPAALAFRLWRRTNRFTLDKTLAPATVIHGTNFIVPPSRQYARVVTVHDCSPIRYPELCSAQVRAAVPALRRAIRDGAWVHVPSTFIAEEVQNLLGADAERVVTIPHGIPRLVGASEIGAAPAPEIQELVERGPFVLWLGTFEPRKNLARLVAAFGRIANDYPEHRLMLAGGDGVHRAAVDAVVASLPFNVRARILVLGYVDSATRTTLLRHAQVLAYPSIYEGFGFPVLEAMLAGTPVIAAQAGAIPEVAGDAALLVEPADVDAIAGALDVVLGDETLAARLVAAGTARTAAFSWDTAATAMTQLYERADNDMEKSRNPTVVNGPKH